MKKMTDFGKRLTEYLNQYLTVECGMSKRTVVTYSYSFTLLLRYLKEEVLIRPEKVTLADITKDRVIKYLKWLETERGCSAATRNYRLAAIKSFFNFLQYRDVSGLGSWHDIMSIKSKKVPEPETTYLTQDGMKLLLQEPDQHTKQGRKDLTLLLLMFDSACRVQEIIDLTPGSISYDGESTFLRVRGKGDKLRMVIISENTLQHLRRYMDEFGLDRPENRSHPLFANPKGNRLTRGGILKMVKKYASTAREKNPELIPEGVTCHSFRRSKAMAMLENGIEYVLIRDTLGHVDISTTERYARANEKMKKEALKKVDPSITIDEMTSWQKEPELLAELKELQKMY